MLKKKAKIYYRKAKKEFAKLSPKVKLVIYVVLVFLFLSFVKTLRTGEIEVIGTHSIQEYNKIATYIISVSDGGSNKETVINNVTTSENKLRELIIDFGIKEIDIKTTNNYIFEKSENQSVRYVSADQKDWVGGTSIEVKLDDINRINGFSVALTELPGLEIYGPTYSVDQDDINEAKLLSAAVRDAKQKASVIARSQNKRLGRILSIQELSSATFGVYGEVLGMGGGLVNSENSEFSPGSTKIVKNVRVTFVLK